MPHDTVDRRLHWCFPMNGVSIGTTGESRSPRSGDAGGRVFVYGTLRNGDVRWPLLRRFVTSTEPIVTTVAGELFDTGNDYPAAVFAADRAVTRVGTRTPTIVGEIYELRPELAERGLARLDVEEDTVGGSYRRVVVTTTDGLAAWAYAYGCGLNLVPIPSGDWLAHRPLPPRR